MVRQEMVLGLDDAKVQYHVVEGRFLVCRIARMYGVSRRLFASGEVDAVVSFNPMPYGLLAMAAGGRRQVPYHLGFIGADVYGSLQSAAWRFMPGILSGAGFATVTGQEMRGRVVAMGVPPERVAVLPHAIDLPKFAPADETDVPYDFIYVGQLIHRKRVDVILHALATLKTQGVKARLCIVGDGVLRHDLERMTADLGLLKDVDFVGYSHEVETYLRRARIFVMASDSEGLPFAMVEAMSCGLVPVTTNVGTISDAVAEGETGFLVKKGDTEMLATRMKQLLVDDSLRRGMRKSILEHRAGFAYTWATSVWDKWIRSVAEGVVR